MSTRFFREAAKKFVQVFPGSFDDLRWGARIQLVEEDDENKVLWLRTPKPGEYGEFLAVCRLCVELKLSMGDILYNPGMIRPRRSFFVLSADYKEDSDYLDMTMCGLPESTRLLSGTSFCYGKYLMNSGDPRWVACIDRTSGKKETYRDEFPGNEDNGLLMRMDLKSWNNPVCLCKHVFNLDGESIEESWQKMWSDFKTWESANLVDHKDPRSIIDFIKTRGSLNFVDLNEKTLTIESKMIQQWLDTLAPTGSDDPMYREKMDTAIMVINNVVVQNLRDPNGAYCGKSMIPSIFDGSTDCEAKYYTTEGIKRVTMSWNYGYVEGEKGKRKKFYWIDMWKESSQRARMTDAVFTPWPITHPVASITGGTGYETNRILNNFSGYRWNMEDLKKAYIDPTYADSVSRFEKLVNDGYCGKKEYSDYVIKWLAWIMQNPQEKSQVAVILKGPKGLGKGWLARFLDMIWGKNYLFIPSKGLDGDFNSHLADRVIVFIDEINPQNIGKNNIDAIKSMITERNTLVHPKHQNQRVARSNINIIGATNNELTNIEVTPDNRRFFITESPISQHDIHKWKPYIEKMWEDFIVGKEAKENDWIRVRSIFYWLVTMNLGDFVPHKKLPWTPYMKKMVEMSIPVVHNWWRFVILRRQISGKDVRASEPCHVERRYYELFIEFKNCDEFSRLYDDNRKKASRLTQAQFSSSLAEVMVYVGERGSDKFVVSCWQDQIGKWNSMYPFSAIDYDASDAINPMVASKIAEMRNTVIDDSIRMLTREELEFALQSIRDEGEEHGFHFKINQSFLKRNTSEDLVVFQNDNKRQRTG